MDNEDVYVRIKHALTGQFELDESMVSRDANVRAITDKMNALTDP